MTEIGTGEAANEVEAGKAVALCLWALTLVGGAVLASFGLRITMPLVDRLTRKLLGGY